jgi:sortase A
MRASIQWIWRALLFGGAGLIAWCGFVLIDARIFQQQQNRVLNSSLKVEGPPARDTSSLVKPPARARGTEPPLVKRGLIGRIEIPRLGLATIVIEGSDQAALQRAAGHIPGTPLPGHAGNSAITGHRDTFFRPLRDIQRDDLIRVTTPKGQYQYRVASLSIVGPDDLRVLDSDGGETLTLITCYPFNYVGGAPRRFVVHAARIPGLTQSSLAR